MPLATTLWICVYRRDRLGLWLSASVALIVVALVASWLLFGVDFFTNLSAPRIWHFAIGPECPSASTCSISARNSRRRLFPKKRVTESFRRKRSHS
jgi:hypothetical protein